MNNASKNQASENNAAACDTNAQSCSTDKNAAAQAANSQECCSESNASGQAMKQGQCCFNAHMGKLVSLSGNILTMTDCDGTHEHTHTVAPDAKMFCDGVACRPEDVPSGATIRVTTRPNDMRVATQIESLAKQAEFAQQA